jgi:3-phenylpropionate/cinnamic acid dioxygenase small subunit
MVQLNPEDRAVINDLYVRYAHAFDGGDADAWAGLFSSDGRFAPPGVPEVVGTDALRAFVQARSAEAPGMRHLIANVLVEASDGGARGRAYFLCFRIGEDGHFRLRNIGRYEDELAREAGEWKIAVRRVVSDLTPELVDATFAFAGH